VSLGPLTTSVNSLLFALSFCGNTNQKCIVNSVWHFAFCCWAIDNILNHQISGKIGFPLVPPYLIISDSPIAFHFHCVILAIPVLQMTN